MSRALRSFKEDELPPASSGGDVVDRLYAELSDLYGRKESSPADNRLDERITQTFERLRAAQADEVRRLRHFFESGLRMPLGAGAELLQRIRELRS